MVEESSCLWFFRYGQSTQRKFCLFVCLVFNNCDDSYDFGFMMLKFVLFEIYFY